MKIVNSTLAFTVVFISFGCSAFGPYAGEQITKFPQEIQQVTCNYGKLNADGSSNVTKIPSWVFYPHENHVIHTDKADLEWRKNTKQDFPLKSEYRNLGEGVEEYIFSWNIIGLVPGGTTGTWSFVAGGKRNNLIKGRSVLVDQSYKILTYDNSIVCEVNKTETSN